MATITKCGTSSQFNRRSATSQDSRNTSRRFYPQSRNQPASQASRVHDRLPDPREWGLQRGPCSSCSGGRGGSKWAVGLAGSESLIRAVSAVLQPVKTTSSSIINDHLATHVKYEADQLYLFTVTYTKNLLHFTFSSSIFFCIIVISLF